MSISGLTVEDFMELNSEIDLVSSEITMSGLLNEQSMADVPVSGQAPQSSPLLESYEPMEGDVDLPPTDLSDGGHLYPDPFGVETLIGRLMDRMDERDRRVDARFDTLYSHILEKSADQSSAQPASVLATITDPALDLVTPLDVTRPETIHVGLREFAAACTAVTLPSLEWVKHLLKGTCIASTSRTAILECHNELASQHARQPKFDELANLLVTKYGIIRARVYFNNRAARMCKACNSFDEVLNVVQDHVLIMQDLYRFKGEPFPTDLKADFLHSLIGWFDDKAAASLVKRWRDIETKKPNADVYAEIETLASNRPAPERVTQQTVFAAASMVGHRPGYSNSSSSKYQVKRTMMTRPINKVKRRMRVVKSQPMFNQLCRGCKQPQCLGGENCSLFGRTCEFCGLKNHDASTCEKKAKKMLKHQMRVNGSSNGSFSSNAQQVNNRTSSSSYTLSLANTQALSPAQMCSSLVVDLHTGMRLTDANPLSIGVVLACVSKEIEERNERYRKNVDNNQSALVLVVLNKRYRTVALLDTGADTSFVHSSLVDNVEITDEPLCVRLVDRSKAVYDCVSFVHVNIGDHVHKCFVSNVLVTPCVLGMDFLRAIDVWIHPRGNRIVLPGGADIQFCSRRALRTMVANAISIAVSKEKDCQVAVNPKLLSEEKPIYKLVERDRNSPAHEYEIVNNLINSLKYCFTTPDKPLGFTPDFCHRIRPKGEAFIMKLKPMSRQEIEIEKGCLEDMLKYGVIRPSQSGWASRPTIVDKKTLTPGGKKEKRYCVNFARLNAMDPDDAYPTPRAPDMLNAVAGAQYFSKLDAAMGYWQIPIHPDDVKYTGVITNHGLFEFVRMPFGLKNAPRTYQRMMDTILRDCLRRFTIVYLDDVLIYSKTFEEHIEHVQHVIKLMYDAGLLLRAKKCAFFVSEVEYLGHILSREGIRMDESKLQRILHLPVPQTTKELHSLLGVFGYYRKFVKNFSSKAAPLFELIKKDVEFVWSDECQRAYDVLRSEFEENICLAQPDYSKPFFVDTDACDIGLGAVLHQVDDNGRERPVFFASRKLSPTERKWPVRDKEGLAIVWALQTFRHHILGCAFTVRTDHASLEWILKAETGRLARWAIVLAEFLPFSIKYRQGELNKVADALSRVYADSEFLPDIAFACGASKVRAPPQDNSVVTPFVTLLRTAMPSRKHLVFEQGRDLFCLKRKATLSAYPKFCILESLLGMTLDGRFRPVLPKALTTDVLRAIHAHPLNAHSGVKRTAARASELFLIPKLRQQCRQVINSCLPCLQRKATEQKVGLLKSPPPLAPWELISMDFCGPYPTSRRGNKYVLVILDQFTKFVELAALTEATARSTITVLYERILCRHGAPRTLLTDNGTPFKNKVMTCVAEVFGFYKAYSSAYYPQGDGHAERFMRNLNDSLSTLAGSDEREWCMFVPGVQFAYNTSPHSVTGITPYQLNHGRLPRFPGAQEYVQTPDSVKSSPMEYARKLAVIISQHQEKARKAMQKAWLQRALAYNRGRKQVKIVVGQRCLVRLTDNQRLQQGVSLKLTPRWSEPRLVVAVKDSGKAFDIQFAEGDIRVVNATRLLPVPSDAWSPANTKIDVSYLDLDKKPDDTEFRTTISLEEDLASPFRKQHCVHAGDLDDLIQYFISDQTVTPESSVTPESGKTQASSSTSTQDFHKSVVTSQMVAQHDDRSSLSFDAIGRAGILHAPIVSNVPTSNDRSSYTVDVVLSECDTPGMSQSSSSSVSLLTPNQIREFPQKPVRSVRNIRSNSVGLSSQTSSFPSSSLQTVSGDEGSLYVPSSDERSPVNPNASVDVGNAPRYWTRRQARLHLDVGDDCGLAL